MKRCLWRQWWLHPSDVGEPRQRGKVQAKVVVRRDKHGFLVFDQTGESGSWEMVSSNSV